MHIDSGPDEPRYFCEDGMCRPFAAQHMDMGPYGFLPPDGRAHFPAPPDDDGCRALWDRHAMPDHIRRHSLAVARVATFVAERAAAKGLPVDPAAVRASALLHDLAKDYTIRHGGNHAQLGGAWAMELTGNAAIAQGVVHHIWWPWDIDLEGRLLPLAVIYGDKRVMHDRIVTIEGRYEDLFSRYGIKGEEIERRITMSKRQAVDIENTLQQLLGIDLNACTFDSGRLV